MQVNLSDTFRLQNAVLLRMSIVHRECGSPISVVILESPIVFFLVNFSQEYTGNNLLGALRRVHCNTARRTRVRMNSLTSLYYR